MTLSEVERKLAEGTKEVQRGKGGEEEGELGHGVGEHEGERRKEQSLLKHILWKCPKLNLIL